MSDGRDRIKLEVITPERQVLRTSAQAVILPALDGYVGVLRGHAPMMVALGVGLVQYGPEHGDKRVLSVGGGLAEVRDDQVEVLADTAELPEEIDVVRAKAAQVRAEGRLHHPAAGLDLLRAEAALRRATIRLQAVERSRGAGGGAREGGFAPGEEHLGEP